MIERPCRFQLVLITPAALISLAHKLGRKGKEVAPEDKCPEVEPG